MIHFFVFNISQPIWHNIHLAGIINTTKIQLLL